VSRLFAPSERLLRISASAPDVGSRALARTVAAIRDRLEADAGRHAELGLTCRLGGDGLVGSEAVDRLIGDMFRSLLVAFAVIFVIMIFVLRSFAAAALSMIPNMLPLLFTLAVMGAVGIDLQVPTIIVFTVALGLAVDDTIHFMVRFREEWRRETAVDPEERYRCTIARTFRGTGQAIFATSVLLGAGYSVLLLSSFPITQKFGVGMLLTVTGALVGDLFVLPACLAFFRPFREGKKPRVATLTGA